MDLTVNKELVYKSLIHTMYAGAIAEAYAFWLKDSATKLMQINDFFCTHADVSCDSVLADKMAALSDGLDATLLGTWNAIKDSSVATLIRSIFDHFTGISEAIDEKTTATFGALLAKVLGFDMSTNTIA